jgi:hypothetical protein
MLLRAVRAFVTLIFAALVCIAVPLLVIYAAALGAFFAFRRNPLELPDDGRLDSMDAD